MRRALCVVALAMVASRAAYAEQPAPPPPPVDTLRSSNLDWRVPIWLEVVSVPDAVSRISDIVRYAGGVILDCYLTPDPHLDVQPSLWVAVPPSTVADAMREIRAVGMLHTAIPPPPYGVLPFDGVPDGYAFRIALTSSGGASGVVAANSGPDLDTPLIVTVLCAVLHIGRGVALRRQRQRRSTTNRSTTSSASATNASAAPTGRAAPSDTTSPSIWGRPGR
jgi:hypothetical protein